MYAQQKICNKGITTHLNSVATLPCETLVFKTCIARKHSSRRLLSGDSVCRQLTRTT